jgi:hypothetical protein
MPIAAGSVAAERMTRSGRIVGCSRSRGVYVLGSPDVRFDVITDHYYFVRVEAEIIEHQVEERACRFTDDVCPDVGGVFERGDERTKVECDPALPPAIAVAM